MAAVTSRSIRLLITAFVVTALFLVGTAGANQHQTGPEPRGATIQNITGTLSNGDFFDGRIVGLQILGATEGAVEATGILQGSVIDAVTGETERVHQRFTSVLPVEVPDVGVLQNGQECQILFLDIGPIFLDLLGLQLDISPIQIDLTAVRGPGNLLDNLLCGLVGILDP